MNDSIYRGEIYFVNGSKDYEKLGSVQGGGRPAIIVSNDIGNAAGPIVEVVYLTTQDKKPLPTHVNIRSAKLPSIALCENIVTVYKDKIGKYIGQCTQHEMKEIDEALAVSVGINVRIKSDALIRKWRDALDSDDEAERKKDDSPAPPDEPKQEKPKVDGVEYMVKLAKVEAERDVYKKLYEDLVAGKAV